MKRNAPTTRTALQPFTMNQWKSQNRNYSFSSVSEFQNGVFWSLLLAMAKQFILAKKEARLFGRMQFERFRTAQTGLFTPHLNSPRCLQPRGATFDPNRL